MAFTVNMFKQFSPAVKRLAANVALQVEAIS